MTDSQGGGRRFAEGLDPDAARFNASVGFDWRLLPHDVAGSIAHARMLARQGIILVDDADRIIAGLVGGPSRNQVTQEVARLERELEAGG